MSEPDSAGGVTRGTFLKRAGTVGLGAAIGGVAVAPPAVPATEVQLAERAGREFFTAEQAATVDAIAARLIPADANGPGATEANVGAYIDRALAGAYSFFQESYTTWISQLDEYCEATYGAAFVDLTANQQDAVLTSMQGNKASGFTSKLDGYPPSDGGSTFFGLMQGHAREGMFGDPFWGGNRNFVGWDLIGYPGVKVTDVTPADQALDTTLKPAHKSGYSYGMFVKTTKKEVEVHPPD